MEVTLEVGRVNGEKPQSVTNKTKELKHFPKSSWEPAGILIKINGQQIWRGEEIGIGRKDRWTEAAGGTGPS